MRLQMRRKHTTVISLIHLRVRTLRIFGGLSLLTHDFDRSILEAEVGTEEVLTSGSLDGREPFSPSNGRAIIVGGKSIDNVHQLGRLPDSQADWLRA